MFIHHRQQELHSLDSGLLFAVSQIEEVIMQKHNPAVHQGLTASQIPDCKYAGAYGAKALATVFLWMATMCALGSPAYGSFESTTTTLSVSPVSVAAGKAVTLTATVTALDPVTTGQVMFCAA